MKTKTIALRIAAALATLGIGIGAAQAVSFNFDHDAADLVHARADFVLAGMDWGQEVGGTTINGKLSGVLTYHGVVAGCVKIRVIWRNGNGAEIGSDVSGQACSNSSAPSLPIGVNETFARSDLRGARVEMQLKEFNSNAFVTIASRAMVAGGN
ncbi:MAG TPA: hypothetical protein VLW55_07705 [Burkholderiaceae bacterium]|nr:hypothetical protein [Burkholderiaceae bacterium]